MPGILPFWFLPSQFIPLHFFLILFKHLVTCNMTNESDFYLWCNGLCFALNKQQQTRSVFPYHSALFLRRLIKPVSSPNLVQTVRRTTLRFLIELLMRCKRQPDFVVQAVHRHASTHPTASQAVKTSTDWQRKLNYAYVKSTEDQVSTRLLSIRGRKPRQWTLRLCQALTYLLVFICWVPQITLTLR